MDDFIYNQYDIPKDKWRYGFRSSAVTGCGWIATYNALRLMGKYVKPESLIRSYEEQVPLVNGNLGTVLFGPGLWFRQRGYKVKMYARRGDFDDAAKNADACILFYRWIRNYKYGAHFIALKYDEDGFTGYNVYRNSIGANYLGQSLSQFLQRRNYFGAVLFTIENKD